MVRNVKMYVLSRYARILAMTSCCAALGTTSSLLRWRLIMGEIECVHARVTGSPSCTEENRQNTVNPLYWNK